MAGFHLIVFLWKASVHGLFTESRFTRGVKKTSAAALAARLRAAAAFMVASGALAGLLLTFA